MSKLRQFIELETIDLVTIEDQFSYRKDKPWWNRWVQCGAFWLLRKLKAYHQAYEASRVHTLPDGPILQQIPQVLERLEPRVMKNQRVVIGAETYAEAIKGEAPRSSFGVIDELMYNRTIYGVEVLVVPHVEGWALVPKSPDVRVH